MDTLDARLENAFTEAGINPYDVVPSAEDLRETLRPLVKQAFIDDGWVKGNQAKVLQELMNLKVNMEASMQRLGMAKVVGEDRMTGQEWYDRFSEQLEKVTADRYHGGFALFDDVTEAAKKAAGIE